MIKFISRFLVILAFVPCLVTGQELQEMQISEVPAEEQQPVVVLDASEAILVVYSTIPNLKFDATLGIIAVDNPSPGVYHVHLRPGTNIVTFSTEEYISSQNRFYIPPRESKQIRITPKLSEGFTENRPELILHYTPSSLQEIVTGSIDEKVMNLNFSTGSVTLRPSAGKHTLKLVSGGKLWEKSFDLKAGERVEEEVLFPKSTTEKIEVKPPGGLYITTNPSGAVIYLNQVEQGRTPLNLENVAVGSYELEAVKPLYLPVKQTIQIKSSEYTDITLDLKPNFGRLEINSSPAGALVYLNGKQVGNTPFIRPQYDANKYKLKLVKPYYQELEGEFEILPNGQFIQSYSLKPQFGKLTVTSNPQGAVVLLDGENWGKTNVIKDTVLSGSHNLKISLQDYQEIEEQITVVDGDNLIKHYNLNPEFALLTIHSTPTGAKITIAGPTTKTLNTPSERVKLADGSYTVKMEKDSFETYEASLMLKKGDIDTLHANLIRKTGNLRISTEPQGAIVYLNGKNKGQTPTIIKDEPTGICEVILEKEGYDPFKAKVEIKYRETASLNPTLSDVNTKDWNKRRTKARIFSVILPGSGQFISRQNIRGAAYSCAFTGSLFLLLQNIQEHKNSKSQYESMRNQYNSAITQPEMDQYYEAMKKETEKMKKYERNANISLYTITGVYAMQLIDSWIFGGGKRLISGQKLGNNKDIKPYAQTNKNYAEFGLKVDF